MNRIRIARSIDFDSIMSLIREAVSDMNDRGIDEVTVLLIEHEGTLTPENTGGAYQG